MIYHLLEKKPSRPAQAAIPSLSEKRGKEPKHNKLVCANCSHTVTSNKSRIEINGSHEHTFANPAGLAFRIGCFNEAPGAMTQNQETIVFTWFAGYSWSQAVCSLCGCHLGWRFKSTNNQFFGIILDRLVENLHSTD